MVQRDMLSVVIPTYNRTKLLAVALESLVNQNYDPIEVIIVDDGSTDKTEEIVSYYKTILDIKYIKQPNQGVTAARNNGLRHVNGEYVAFLDSDDIWLPEKARKQIEIFKRYPGVVQVWTDMSCADLSGRITKPKFLKEFYSSYKYFDFDKITESVEIGGDRVQIGDIYPYMIFGNIVHTSTTMIRRSVLNEVCEFNPEFKRSGEDYDFHFRSAMCGRSAYIDQSYVVYRFGAPDQLTHSDYDLECACNNLTTVSHRLKLTPERFKVISSRKLDLRLFECYNWVATILFDQGELIRSRYFYYQSLKYKFSFKSVIRLLLGYLPGDFGFSVFNFLRQVKNYVHAVR